MPRAPSCMRFRSGRVYKQEADVLSMMSQNLASLAGYLDVCTFTELETHVREDPDGDTEVKEDKMWQQQKLLAYVYFVLWEIYELL